MASVIQPTRLVSHSTSTPPQQNHQTSKPTAPQDKITLSSASRARPSPPAVQRSTTTGAAKPPSSSGVERGGAKR
jgi:hypothetical protein